MSLNVVQKNEQEVTRLKKGLRSVMEGDNIGRGNSLFKGLEL